MDEEKCRAEFGDNMAWACAKCPKAKAETLSPYTQKMFRIRALQKAGYPMRANDLTFEEWLDLAEVETWLMQPPSKSRSE